MPKAEIAIIGGSGLYNMKGLTDTEEVEMDTPFGKPSDVIVIGNLEGKRVAFLPRHGKGHRINPTNIPARANIFALKRLGVQSVVSVSAVGSLQEEIRPLDMVIPDQIIDRTKSRINSFFEDGIVVHAAFSDPFCQTLSNVLYDVAGSIAERAHNAGTYVVMEGPLFSTRAESQLYRSWGASVIGMTALPEAKLAREAEMCYSILACATDYDCWHQTHDSVSADMIINNLLKNVEVSQEIVRRLVGKLPNPRSCDCQNALKNAIITSREHISPEVRERLEPLIGKYLS